MTLERSTTDVDDSESIIWYKLNFSYLQSFFNYSKSFGQQNVYYDTGMKLALYEWLRGGKKKLQICREVLTPSTQPQLGV